MGHRWPLVRVNRQIHTLSLALTLAMGFALSSHAQTTPPPSRDAGILASALQAARNGRFDEARSLAARAQPIAQDLIQWIALHEGAGTLSDYQAFLATHGHWPLTNPIRRHAEALITARPDAEIIAHFRDHPPLTDAARFALVMAAPDAALARALYVAGDLSAAQLAQLEQLFPELRALLPERVDQALWDGRRAAARALLDRLDPAHHALARARLALQERANGVNALVAAVPANLQSHPGLMYDRFEFRMRAGNHDGAAELIMAQSRAPEGLGQPEEWGRRRVFLVRQAMADGAFQRAYDLATPHGLDDGLHFVDLEFLAGIIALEHLKRPRDALGHFRALRVRVSSPISMGRAGFWEGRAHEALGDPISARSAYEFGAEHQTSFYGQLAAERLQMPLDPALLTAPDYPHWRDTDLAQSDLLAASLALHEAGQWHEARRFSLFLARELEDEARFGALAELWLSRNEPNFALNLAKMASAQGIILPRALFPVTDLAKADLPAPMDLVMAIARRESEFDPAVISPADARGLMQVLPGTGQMMARKLGVPFQASDLTSNPALNARLGAAYLQDLRAEFGPALTLVAAGYNAGPGRPRQWIPRLGDPRDPNVDILHWVENVPFAETRNYIMRVAESLVIYRALLAGQSQPIEMERILRGR